MMPGMGRMNPRMMKKLQKQLKQSTEEIDATEVIIRTPEKELYFDAPSVTAMDMMGQKSFQVVGEPQERPLGSGTAADAGDAAAQIPAEDVALVAAQAGVSEEAALEALRECNGEPAEAIIRLMEG
ncbi:MAG: nascent polypeptide-associated complex protein [Euryarchaeota archaeon]|jgi:nascent polypeptide-associated complex subunit alpha|nr:nascent polypeptide-associated complex protein [Euryarchaeota archaeon]MDP6363981.1 nascent polypeptide-associated complex protein [Candidatus Poseidoniia archaeon]MDP6658622.1 nascent polypeptide-associated complex protein [Candidatus Poseidoniia archaeon]MDP6846962.1 nascent polypeptide-associated complex protein [Candidatus Poseidoniia archaeon]MDP7006575.1 nascent polypeptide-associated complex protein [Candidatus Poseidoniia archaeon]|tara:strand:+ start:186 stop:563 length:378 start_codon:yes stop_codon:yes gene_type:complete